MLTIVTVTLLTLEAAWLIVCLFRRIVAPLPRQLGEVQEPAGMLWLCMALTGVFAAAAIVSLVTRTAAEAAGYALLALLFTAFSTFFALPLVRWNAEGFTVRDALGRTRACRWDEVRGVVRTKPRARQSDTPVLVTAQGDFAINAHAGRRAGGSRFWQMVERTYAEQHGEPLPTVAHTAFCGGRVRYDAISSTAVLTVIWLAQAVLWTLGQLAPELAFIPDSLVLAGAVTLALLWSWLWLGAQVSRNAEKWPGWLHWLTKGLWEAEK
ncbi:MAG: hypothetical protein IJ343_06285 [Clostridia bacterium]|nr:hypothetical protein [Clostridia bacterium]